MKRALQFLTVISLIIVSSAYGQEEQETWEPPVDGYIGLVKQNKREPMPLPELNPENISYSKRVWQELDGRLSINRGIISPSNNLISILVRHIKDGSVTAYDPTPNPDKGDPNGDSFKTRLTPSEALFKLTGTDSILVEVYDENGDVTDQNWVSPDFDPESVFLFRIKEDWIFDEKRSVFEPRIVGIAPLIIPKINGINTQVPSFSYENETELSSSVDPFDAFSIQLDAQPAFWLYFPEIRNVLVNEFIPNDFNDAEGVSYDDFFISRHFDSYIIKVSNSQNLRIKDYKKTKVEQLLESERLKQELMNYQSDLYRN